MKTIFDHLRECAGNGDMPTLDAEDAQRIVETYDELIDSMTEVLRISDRKHDAWDRAYAAIKDATESRPLQIERN